MARMTGGRALVEMLTRHGVDTLFALPGVQNDALFVALYDAGEAIRVIHPRHEQAAAYMAFGYARASGRPGAFAVVPGPGLLNTTAALAHRLRDQRAGAVHLGTDPVEPDRPRLRPAARDPGPARDPARADEMGRAHQSPERDRPSGQRGVPPDAARPAAPGRARNAARHHGAGGRGRPAGCRERAAPAAARPGADRAGRQAARRRESSR